LTHIVILLYSALLERAMTYILSTAKPGQKGVLSLDMLLSKKLVAEKKLGIILH
jgi:hypothetical protein